MLYFIIQTSQKFNHYDIIENLIIPKFLSTTKQYYKEYPPHIS